MEIPITLILHQFNIPSIIRYTKYCDFVTYYTLWKHAIVVLNCILHDIFLIIMVCFFILLCFVVSTLPLLKMSNTFSISVWTYFLLLKRFHGTVYMYLDLITLYRWFHIPNVKKCFKWTTWLEWLNLWNRILSVVVSKTVLLSSRKVREQSE